MLVWLHWFCGCSVLLYIIEHNKEFDSYLKKCEFILVFNDYQFRPHVTCKYSDKKTMIPWKIFLMEVIDDFKDKGYNFSHIAEMHIITIMKSICRMISISNVIFVL